jgi:hypothetical protein
MQTIYEEMSAVYVRNIPRVTLSADRRENSHVLAKIYTMTQEKTSHQESHQSTCQRKIKDIVLENRRMT